jgi:hypothetical protein
MLTGIRETIAAAIHVEGDNHQLRFKLTDHLPRLKEKLALPEEDPVGALMSFITAYIESVPHCINVVTAVSKQLGFYDYASPFLHMAEDYFLHPPEDLPVSGGLEALLDEAFLAHRLMEEVNDHHIRHLHRPLLPIDMTEANIIVHHLLGDPLASRLDQLVQYAASQRLLKAHLWQPLLDQPGTSVLPALVLASDSILGAPDQIRLRLAKLA